MIEHFCGGSKFFTIHYSLFPFFHYFCNMNINEKTWSFIREHADEDVRKVALQGTKDPDVDLQVALQQIAGRQTARKKLPSWAAVEGIVYPPHLNMEQCSSELTARYKAKIVGEDDNMADLTGGFGIDFYWMAKAISQHLTPNTQSTSNRTNSFVRLPVKTLHFWASTVPFVAVTQRHT